MFAFVSCDPCNSSSSSPFPEQDGGWLLSDVASGRTLGPDLTFCGIGRSICIAVLLRSSSSVSGCDVQALGAFDTTDGIEALDETVVPWLAGKVASNEAALVSEG